MKTRRSGNGRHSNAEASPTVLARNGHREVFPLPENLTLRVRTRPNKQDQKAEDLVRALIAERGKDPARILTIVRRADWPSSKDALGFAYPQLVVQGVYWKGLRAIQTYVNSMRSGISNTR